MSEFEDFVAKKQKPEPNFGGTFDCQTCGQEVHEAYYDRENKMLIWWCSQEHTSYLEKFSF